MTAEYQRHVYLERPTKVLDRYVPRTSGSAYSGRWKVVHEQGIFLARKQHGDQGQNRPRKGP
jgi:hypothetical protein